MGVYIERVGNFYIVRGFHFCWKFTSRKEAEEALDAAWEKHCRNLEAAQ